MGTLTVRWIFLYIVFQAFCVFFWQHNTPQASLGSGWDVANDDGWQEDSSLTITCSFWLKEKKNFFCENTHSVISRTLWMFSKLVSNLETEDIDYNSYPIYSKSCWMKKEKWQRYPSWTNTSYMVQSKPKTVKPREIYEKSLREVNISEVAFVILLLGNHFSARHFSCCHPETFLFWNKNPPSTILWLKCSVFTSKRFFSPVIKVGILTMELLWSYNTWTSSMGIVKGFSSLNLNLKNLS